VGSLTTFAPNATVVARAPIVPTDNASDYDSWAFFVFFQEGFDMINDDDWRTS
jgi:hypothetical protein